MTKPPPFAYRPCRPGGHLATWVPVPAALNQEQHMTDAANTRPDPNADFVEEFFQHNQSCAANSTVQTFLKMVRQGKYTYPQAMCGMIAALCNQNAELTGALEQARARRA